MHIENRNRRYPQRKESIMKPNLKSVISLAAIVLAVSLTNFCRAGVVVTSPQIVITPPAVTVAVPDSYVWDGNEYVGVVGSQYYYLGPGNVWVVMDPPRLHRFQTWERGHPDWRSHATRNVHYRNMDRGNRPQPMHSSPPANHDQTPDRHANPDQHGPGH